MPANFREVICYYCHQSYQVPYSFQVPVYNGHVECFKCNLKREPHTVGCSCIICKFFGPQSSEEE